MKPGVNRQTRVALSLRTSIQFTISVRSNCKAGHLCFNTVFNSVLFLLSRSHTHTFHITRTVLVKGSVDCKHIQVACMACWSSDGHGGAACLEGVCSTHMASLSPGLSVSHRRFNPHSSRLMWGQLDKGQCVYKKELQLRQKAGGKKGYSL